MKGRYTLLTKMQLYNLFGINRMIHSKVKKERNHIVFIGSFSLILFAFMLVYSTLFVRTCIRLGLIDILPSFMLTISFLITLFFTFIKGSNMLFGVNDYDMVMSLPVTSTQVVLSRLTSVYILNILIGVIALAPASIFFGNLLNEPISFYIMILFTLFLSPLIPMIIAIALSTVITIFSSKFKNKNILSLIFSTLVVLVFIIVLGIFEAQGEVAIETIGITIANLINHIYPLAYIITTALLKGSWFHFGAYSIISVSIAGIFVMILANYYTKINTAVSSNGSKSNFKLGEIKKNSVFMAMYKKELRRFLSCTIYALNSSICLVLLIITSIALLIIGKVNLQLAGQMKLIYDSGIKAAPFISALLVGLSSTTSVALSLEGKSRWIMASLPVSSKQIFKSKIAVNLTTTLPVIVVSSILQCIALDSSFIESIFIFIIPIAYAFYISILGMGMDVKFCRYDWTSEYNAVKGSISVLIVMGIGIASAFIPMVLYLAFNKYNLIISILTIIIITIISAIIYKKLVNKKIYV
ncbi:hypothetical protein CDLVIII_5301 [Clostridium sp. DL-VIII]|uniref:hypothetical protein n=1 Tax=Clostridium sp. DL-VIII TaxID=641107 RepID=UPI00023B02E9|nr:hypothetical protein [Clostridium sp. DL-VIII]EHJ01783.1 hypothetical protein CDLVIII_5301 [Clostridium sp. DL-VIII]